MLTSWSLRKKISNIKDLVPLLEAVVQQSKPLLIVAEDVDGEALATLVINRLRGTFKCAAVKAPGYGDRRKAMMEDIAILTGGHGDLRSSWCETRIAQAYRSRSSQESDHRQGQHHDHRRCWQEYRHQSSNRSNSSRNRKLHQRLRQRESWKSDSPSFLVVLPRSTLVPQPKVK